MADSATAAANNASRTDPPEGKMVSGTASSTVAMLQVPATRLMRACGADMCEGTVDAADDEAEQADSRQTGTATAIRPTITMATTSALSVLLPIIT
jgi:hypothetical protein